MWFKSTVQKFLVSTLRIFCKGSTVKKKTNKQTNKQAGNKTKQEVKVGGITGMEMILVSQSRAQFNLSLSLTYRYCTCCTVDQLIFNLLLTAF